jgi:hypothetical protein
VIRCSLKTLGHKTIAEHDSILQQIVSRSLGNFLMDECGFIYIILYFIILYYIFNMLYYIIFFSFGTAVLYDFRFIGKDEVHFDIVP